MPAKPVAIFCAFGVGVLLTAGGLRPAHAAKPPTPTVLLFPASAADVPALVDLRTRLRVDGQLQVLTYDTDSAIVKRIAAEASHPEWLVAPALTDDTRLALARALGVAFYAVVSPGRDASSTHIQLVETAPTARIFDWVGVNRQYGAHAIESQAVLDLPPSPVVVAAAPAPVVVAAAPAPVVVAAAPPQTLPEMTVPVAPAVKPEIAPPTPVRTAPVIAALPTPAAVSLVPAPKIIAAPAPPLVVARLPQEIVSPAVLPVPEPLIQPMPIERPQPQKARVPLPAPLPVPLLVLPQARAEDLTAVSPLMRRGDSALSGGDVVGAISFYRQAVNGAPLSAIPRLKLAQAYQQGGLTEKSLDEARRALAIAPDSLAIQQFLTQLDQDNGTSDGAITRYHAMLDRNPQDAAAHSGLADALWNSGDMAGAEAEYKAAKRLAPDGDHSADAHLAQLYATLARYDDCLAELHASGKDGYSLAIHIVKNRADTLSSTVDASREAFAKGKSTREQFYDDAKKVSAQAQALAAFVAKITPPAEFKLSHLHRTLATNLIAQESATLVTFIETGDASLGDSVSQLDKEAQTEMLTARAAEEQRGLWAADKVEANK